MKMHVEDFIEQHIHINYCEAIIYPDGDIEYAFPSHINKLADISGKTLVELEKIIPLTAEPLSWLLGYTKCVSLWYDSFQFDSINDAQLKTISLLVKNGALQNGILGDYTDEYNRSEIFKRINAGENLKVPEVTHRNIMVDKKGVHRDIVFNKTSDNNSKAKLLRNVSGKPLYECRQIINKVNGDLFEAFKLK